MSGMEFVIIVGFFGVLALINHRRRRHHKPSRPRHVRLFLSDRSEGMASNNPTVTWGASASGHVDTYRIDWSVNGNAIGSASVARSDAGDAGGDTGYKSDLQGSFPDAFAALKGGDSVSCLVFAVDAADNLISAGAPPINGPVIIPTVPQAPSPPQAVNLTLA